MTEMQLRLKVVKGITAYIGTTEWSSNHLKLIKIFNDSGLCPRYTMTANDAWCALTASDAYIIAGLAGTGKGKIFPCVECACSAMIEKAKAAGIWVENDAYKPKPADLVFYDWEDNGSGDNKGDPDHVGVVVSCEDDIIRIFEGNMGEGICGYRSINVDGRYIRGFITPDFKKIADNIVKTKTACAIYTHSYKDVVNHSIPFVKVKKGQALTFVKDKGNGWSQVKYKGKVYWIMNINLKIDDFSTFEKIVLSKTTKARQIVNGKLSKTTTKFKKGTKLKIICVMQSGDFAGYAYVGKGSKRFFTKL